MTTYEKIVKGATKIKLAAPKTKYIEPILIVTHSARNINDEDFRTIMRALSVRLQDTAWSVVFKALLVVHIMIREGEGDLTLTYLAKHYKMLECTTVSRSAGQGNHGDIRTLKTYSKYLITRSKEFATTKIDYVRDERAHNAASTNPESGGRLRRLTVEKGVLREVESVQRQIDALLRCKYAEAEVNNDIILTSFRMLVHDLLSLYQCLNEGVINILEHYFEMSKVDAERALNIYKDFVEQTADVVSYLRIAKHLEYATKLHVPTIKHAPTALANSLEDYLNDPSFELNRSQYLAEKRGKEYQNKKTGSNTNLLREEKSLDPKKLEEPQKVEANSTQTQNTQNQNQTAYNPWDFSVQQNNVGFTEQPAFTNSNNQQFSQQYTNNALSKNPTTVLTPALTGGFTQQPAISQQQQAQAAAQPIALTPVFTATGFASDQQQQQQHLQPLHPFHTSAGTNIFQQQQSQPAPAPALTTAFTGTGFGGYSAQPQSQPQPLQYAHTNPFSSDVGNRAVSTFGGIGNFQQQQPLTSTATGNVFQQQPLLTTTNTGTVFQQHAGQQNRRSSKLNPFALANIQEESSSSHSPPSNPTTNPFSNTRFSDKSGTTALTFSKTGTTKPEQRMSLSAMHTGTNPFRSAEEPNSSAQQQQQNPLRPQVTAGGLENWQTVPVFPETQRKFAQEQANLKAQFELEQQKLKLAQQQQQQQFQQQPTGMFNNGGFSVQPNYTGYANYNNVNPGAQIPPASTAFSTNNGFSLRPSSTGFTANNQTQALGPQNTGNPFLQNQNTMQIPQQQNTGYNGPSLI
ncbi:hypothetical protein PACTADRAFT_66205 [Pachysolen tannophilus NRRL Y-2460]|uniref:ENTH domain-containing protein n=1 Tax=Pachysolen tannophilus NRRL Y-2460 TaxID=669874 RepID=A0A1E4TZS3_PACTA|nr:hypothetical protein PACTADRAFT_66205 [Pachysolen tannophilus NRRL Y-2460]